MTHVGRDWVVVGTSRPVSYQEAQELAAWLEELQVLDEITIETLSAKRAKARAWARRTAEAKGANS